MPFSSLLIRLLPPALGLLCALLPVTATGNDVLQIAVAANFRAAADVLGERFYHRGRGAVAITSASTGVLAAQLREGAPFDLLLAADSARPMALVKDGLAAEASRCYARGTLVLLGAASIETALSDPTLSMAIGNPATAPYGAAAMAVLDRPQFAGGRGRRILRGANVIQAFQFYSRGGADLALVASSLSPTEGIRIPDDWYPPIEQHAVISRRSRQIDRARAFLDFLDETENGVLLSSLGYRTCQ